MVSNFPAGCGIANPWGGREGFHARPRVPGRAQPASKENPLVTLPIGINAPFRCLKGHRNLGSGL
jgi:hypothetical protein